ncbi:MAG TPA: hypothetical protein VGX68_03305 [Thermoanaerobaculia bacterium]|jgi:hypothetical protein|nr:hypothetical protein [Thermoanaerobaculia bacterium]
MADWESLGGVDPRRLTEVRLQLHWMAQAAAAVGKQLIPHRPDYSEQSFQWSEGLRALLQEPVNGERPFRAGLRPSPPALLMASGSDEILRELPLDGRTLDEAYAWMSVQVAELLGRPLQQPLERPGELPAHPVGAGAPFSFPCANAFAEIGRYYADADRLLRQVRERNPGASAVRCWPHHFDIATLITLDPAADAERAPSIGAGFSPGDGSYDEPYFYVLPWPAPQGRLPELAGGGRWHTEGWTGAVLEASRFTGAGSNGAQAQRVEDFLSSAVAACHRLLATQP